MAQWYTWLGDSPSWLQMWRLTMVPMTACRGSQVWTGLMGSHAGAGMPSKACTCRCGQGCGQPCWWHLKLAGAAKFTEPSDSLGCGPYIQQVVTAVLHRECRCST